MFRDPDPGLMHAAIFWGFVILTIGTADRVLFGLSQAHHRLAGRWLAVAPAAARLRTCSRWASSFGVGWALARRLVARPRAPDAVARRADHPAAHRRRGRDRAAGRGVPAGRATATPTPPGTSWPTRLSVVFGGLAPEAQLAGLRASSAGRTSLLVCFFLVYLPRSKHLHIATAFFNTALRKLKPRGELPAMDLEAETARFGVKTIEDLSLEGPARRLHLHRVRPLPGRLPGLGDGQAAQPQDADHGPARDVGRGGAGVGLLPLIPFIRARTRPASRPARRAPTPWPAHRRHGHPLRRGLGLRHLRRLRRGLPGAHRARRQDRRPAPQPGPRGVRASRPS